MNNIENEIEIAWRERIAQNIELCVPRVIQLRHALQLQGAQSSAESVLTAMRKSASLGHRSSDISEVVLLMASLSRTHGKLPVSVVQVEAVFEFHEAESLELPYQYFFQKGMNHFVSAHYTEAFELFLSARLLAKSIFEEIYSLCNALMCLENLGLPHGHMKHELDLCLAKADLSSIPQDVLSQINAWGLRQDFRNGALANISDALWESSAVSQVNYYKLWVQCLPFHKNHGQYTDADFERFIVSSPHSVQKAYRSRTLQGLLAEDDTHNFRISEFADRLYLWLWTWLVTPEKLPLEKVTLLLSRSNVTQLSERLAVDDYYLIRNALQWLAFFDPASTAKLSQIIARLKPLQSKIPLLFEFEEMMILYFSALRDCDDHEAGRYLVALKSHSLWTQRDLLWPLLINVIGAKGASAELGSLQPLATNLVDYIYPLREQKHMVVNLAQMRIEFRDGTDLVSEPVCRCLELIHRKGVVEFQEILLNCFETRHYDAYMHNPKVFNLVSRLKKIVPVEIKIKTKDARLYVTGSWRDVSFIYPSRPSDKLALQSEWLQFLTHADQASSVQRAEERDLKMKIAFENLKNKRCFRREELQAACGFSRSTSNRVLLEWSEKGLVTKNGRAKNTFYNFTEKVNDL